MNPADIPSKLRKLAEGFFLESKDLLLEAASALEGRERYEIEQVVEDRPNGDKRGTLRIWIDGQSVAGDNIILQGPPCDVDEFLRGEATLEELGDRWRGSSRN